MSKAKMLMIFSIFLVFGCSGNRFKDNSDAHVFSFGLAGYDDYKFCKSKVPNFIGKYSNNINPSRNCIHYQYYTCHITHYCPNLPTESERKKCERDAAQYWIPNWTDAHGDLEKGVLISKQVCEKQAQNCNSALKNDQTCRK